MFGINKNGTKHKIGIIMPAFFPASRTTYDGTSSGLSATRVQGAIDEVVSNVETIIQESVFTVEESGGVWYLYWHGATGECPWSVTQSGTDYELNFTYTTA